MSENIHRALIIMFENTHSDKGLNIMFENIHSEER